MRRPARLAAAAPAALLLAALSLWAAAAQQEEPFPHDEHRGLFPLCTGCHEGIPDGDEATYYPPPEQCVECHDGVDEERVTWTGPTTEVTNLDFDHPTHDRELAAAGDPELDCSDCHTQEGADRMDVRLTVVDRCLSCHAHEAECREEMAS